jgi:cyclopropane fatty-acyl-phospholipid synthase-like methyltransferase
MDKKMSNKQYDGIADEYSQMENPPKTYVVIPTFDKIIGDVQGKSVLDLACGDGFFTRRLLGLNLSEIMGIDISQEMIKKANQDNSGIEYLVGDVQTLQLNRKFDLITAVHLLNYSQTANELATMCEKIYAHLNENGRFSTITINPDLKPMTEFEYERIFESVAKKDFFEDGDQIKVIVKEEGKAPFEFLTYYWTKETYETCLGNAGFKSVQWVDSVISKEGIEKYGHEYWEKYRQNHSAVGIICE